MEQLCIIKVGRIKCIFYQQEFTKAQIEKYMSARLKMNLKSVFDQYLRQVTIPTLEIKFEKNAVKYRWTNCVPDFNLPIKTSSGVLSCIYQMDETIFDLQKTIRLGSEYVCECEVKKN